MTDKRQSKQPDEHAKASETVRPHENPGPRGNPEIEQDSLERGIEKLERVKPY